MNRKGETIYTFALEKHSKKFVLINNVNANVKI
jgi:hypothetical protein